MQVMSYFPRLATSFMPHQPGSVKILFDEVHSNQAKQSLGRKCTLSDNCVYVTNISLLPYITAQIFNN